ncbi:MAG: lipoyl(octanoyl) transferase [Polyangiaceae bacterium]|jgi:lipoyl(octanoyl) transferase
MEGFLAHWLGRAAYGPVRALQDNLLAARLAGRIGNELLLVEHTPVITLGRGAHLEHVLASRDALAVEGIELCETTRGGDVTYHGPGQLVAYPIFDLRPDRCDVRKYVRDLAAVMVKLAARYRIDASFIEGAPKLVGVWVDRESPQAWRGDPRTPDGAEAPEKIGAIGVRISRWVTMHGFAFNVSTRLADFAHIVPCGIRGYGVTSLASLRQRWPSLPPTPGVEEVGRASVAAFSEVFGVQGSLAEPAETAALLEAFRA